jgi:hypothetical protein
VRSDHTDPAVSRRYCFPNDRPLTRLEPSLQVATWELIRALSKEPDASIIQEIVDWLRDAIATGWQERQRQLQGTPTVRLSFDSGSQTPRPPSALIATSPPTELSLALIGDAFTDEHQLIKKLFSLFSSHSDRPASKSILKT